MSKARTEARRCLAQRFALLCLAVGAPSLPAATLYVNVANPAPATPYLTWAAAATNIQDAVDAADTGDEIVVTNGVYGTGVRVAGGNFVSNRVAITKAVTVRSVNGPDLTFITGHSVPFEWIRCVYLASGARLAGFTLSDGGAGFDVSGGGVAGESLTSVVSNCVLSGNRALLYGGGANGCTLQNCVLEDNFAEYGGGGAASSFLTNCVLAGNQSANDDDGGGGAAFSVLYDCRIVGNSAGRGTGGGAYDSTLQGCLLADNASDEWSGGGASYSVLRDCVLTNNVALEASGGGAYESMLHGCLVVSNRAWRGGGVSQSVLNDCTIVGNRALDGDGGGASGSTLTNCVLRYNIAGSDGGGGGAAHSTLIRCVLESNTGQYGGGIRGSTATECILNSNSAWRTSGGGAQDSTLVNCLLAGNQAGISGGGAFNSDLVHCTIVSNWAASAAGGAAGRLTNCIVYDNQTIHSPATPNYFTGAILHHCCTWPLPGGIGNITNAPAFANPAVGDFRLLPRSPCVDAGTDLSGILSTDFNGLRRPLDGNRDGIAGFDLGAFEFNPLFFTSVTREGGGVRLCWFDSLPGMQLQAAPVLPGHSSWTNVPFASGTNGVKLPSGAGKLFFRLMIP